MLRKVRCWQGGMPPSSMVRNSRARAAFRLAVAVALLAAICLAETNAASRGITRGGTGSRRAGGLSPQPQTKLPKTKKIQLPQKSPSEVCASFKLRELPPIRVPPFKCKSYFDWSAISLVGADLQNPQSLLAGDQTARNKLEILMLKSLGGWQVPPQATQDAHFNAFSGSNHFLVYSKDNIPEDEALNRLVLMANSAAVGLVRPGEEHLISTQMIKTAAELFGNHELLGAITFGGGLRDSAPFRIREEDSQRGGMAYIDAAVSGPVFVNRAAFLQVGSFWRSCTDAKCWDRSLLELSLRMWESGFTVAAATSSSTVDGQDLRRRHLHMADGEMPYWLQKLREKPTAEEIWKEGEAEEVTDRPMPGGIKAGAPHFTMQGAGEGPASVPTAARDTPVRTLGLAHTCISNLSPEVSSRLRAVSMARQEFSGMASSVGDTGDEKRIKQNQERMRHEWGDLRIRPPSLALGVCGAVNASSFRGHDTRCTFDHPRVSMIMQYFKRSQNVKVLSDGIASTTNGLGTELIINDDSRSDLEDWFSQLKAAKYDGNVFVSMSPNIHEIRGYNKLSKFATGTYLAHMQDDDVPRDRNWLVHALTLLRNQPRLAVLGGLRGRMDYGTIMDTRSNYINGPKYGAPSDKRACCKKILHWDAKSKIPFMNMYKVNLSPFILPRDRFLEMGMYHLHFSCAGHPGIGLDFELSIRAWRMGFQTGLYYSNFKLQVGQSRGTGTRASKGLFNIRRNNELRNNQMMYKMYNGFHHKKGNSAAAAALKKLPSVKGWVPMNDMGGNKDFLSKHKGWYLNNVVKKNSKAGMEEYRKFAREAERKGKGT